MSLITRAHATDGHGPDAIYMKPRDGGLKMPRGTEVFRQAVRKMAAISEEAITAAGLSLADIRFLVPHQANQRITDAVADELGFQPEHVASTISKYGNTGCASIVIAFDEVVGKLRDGEHALLVTFGGGYSSAAMAIRAHGAIGGNRTHLSSVNGSNGSVGGNGAKSRLQVGSKVDRRAQPLVPPSFDRYRLLADEQAFIEKLVKNGGPESSEYPALTRWFVNVHEKCSSGLLSSHEAIKLRELFGAAMSAATLQGFVCHQPHGYPGDFEIIDRIYTTHLSPRPDLMRWDAYFHAQKASKAVRNRKQYFHELSHGAIVRNRIFRYPLEVFLWGMNFIPATMWRRVHNQTHHVHANTPLDPDRPFLASEESTPTKLYSKLLYPQRSAIRINPLVAFHLSGYIIRNTVASLCSEQKKPRIVPACPRYSLTQRWAIVGEIGFILLWQFIVFYLVGSSWPKWIWASVASYVFTSGLVMSYIFTNHFLNPISETHDPLAHTTSVVVPRWMDRLHQHFSLHTEHHLFPSLNSDYYPAVTEALKKEFPDRYNVLPMAEAWRRLWRRDYFADLNSIELVDSRADSTAGGTTRKPASAPNAHNSFTRI